MAIEKRIPEDLRRRIGDALQRSIPESLSPSQLSSLTNELGERGFKDLQQELFTAVVGAVSSEEFAKQAEATERVNQLKGGLTSETDEEGKRHPSRAKHFMLLSLALFALVGFLIWNSFRQTSAQKLARPQVTTEDAQVPTSVQPDEEPKVDLGKGEGAPPSSPPDSQAKEEPPLEPTVPAPRFGAKGEIYDTGESDYYAYGAQGFDSTGYGTEGYDQGPGTYAEVPPLKGGGGARLALAGGGGSNPTKLTGGLAASGRLAGGAAKNQPLAGGADGGGDKLGGGSFAERASLGGGVSMEHQTEARRAALASSGSASVGGSTRVRTPTSSTRLSVPSVSSPRPPQQTTARSAAILAPGTLLSGKIEAAPVLATGLSEAPVSVKDEEGRIWLGVARLAGASGRAMITLDEVVIGGRLYQVKASVLSTDHVYGVKVQAKEVAPAIASSTLRAALGGVAEYVKGVQGATKVYVDANGNRVEEKTPPRVEWVVAKRLAEVFDLPIEEKAISRIFVIDSGQRVRILVRQSPRPADDAR